MIFGKQKFSILEINSLPRMNDNDIPYFDSMMSHLFNCAINSKNKVFVLATSDGKCYRAAYHQNKINLNFTSYTYKH